MKTKQFLTLISVILLITVTFSSCDCKNKKVATTTTTDSTQIIDIHNAENSIDWSGTYEGVLPCASCPGIKTSIILKDDYTFEKTIEYLESGEAPETTMGTLVFSEDGNKIAIEEGLYLIGENQITSLDINGNVIEGELAENYILKKK